MTEFSQDYYINKSSVLQFGNDERHLTNEAFNQLHRRLCKTKKNKSDLEAFKPWGPAITPIENELCLMIETFAEFAYREGPGWTANPDVANIFEQKFKEYLDKLRDLISPLPPEFQEIFTKEQAVWKSNRECSAHVRVTNIRLTFDIQYFINLMQGYLYWLMLLRHDLEKL